MPNVDVEVAHSKKWDAEDISEEISQELDGLNPDFLILVSTIHHSSEYKGILENISEEVGDAEIIGGSVAGFITNEGVATRGTAAMAVEGANIDVRSSIGKNTKRNPSKAAENCYKGYSKFLDEEEGSVILNFVSGASIPKIPIIGRVNNSQSNLFSYLISSLGLKLASYLGTGVGKEEKVMEEFSSLVGEKLTIGGSTSDGLKYLSNFQFYGQEVQRNSIVSLAISTELEKQTGSILNAGEVKEEFEITNSSLDGYLINEIEDEPAKSYFLNEVIGISEDQFKSAEAFYYKSSEYFPIGFRNKEDYITGVGGMIGQNLLLGYRAPAKSATLLSPSGDEILNDQEELVSVLEGSGLFSIGFISESVINLLGSGIFDLKEVYDKKFGDEPFLIVSVMNEHIGQDKIRNRVYSTDIIRFRGE